ncbi:hypothetical protein NDU88_005522 [Pleurodeles waltl]|uniref:Uncharacterized protein n=1 Tax=Pleurodeles waltl TaxID=8319 RepID=A0AAV7PFT4_PLEWA|nr:hypothetical protein NDU88_005522 [Pleurodeles waltl]
MDAIQVLKNNIEQKIDAVTLDVNLLCTDPRKVTDKVTTAEGQISGLHAINKGSGADRGLKNKKEKKLQIEELEKEVGALETQLPRNRTEELRWQLLAKQAQLRDLADDEARKYAPATQGRPYDFGD